jgi:hypothetical protein
MKMPDGLSAAVRRVGRGWSASVSHAYYRIQCAVVLVLQRGTATSTAFRMNTAMCSPLPNERVSWWKIDGDWLKRKFCDLAFHRRLNFPTGSSASQPIGAAAGQGGGSHPSEVLRSMDMPRGRVDGVARPSSPHGRGAYSP